MPDILAFIKANNFDILCFQELSGGVYTLDHQENLAQFNQALPQYYGELVKTSNMPGDINSYVGNAIFIKNELQIVKRDDVWMNDFIEQEIITDDPRNSELGLAVIALTLKLEPESTQTLTIATGHFMWEKFPGDTETKINRARIAYDYLASLDHPFILTGDFNVEAHTKTSSQFGQIARNLSVEAKLLNTLNPNRSRHKHLFPPGIMCDYIFPSPGINILEFKVIDKPELSDHFGLYLEFEF